MKQVFECDAKVSDEKIWKIAAQKSVFSPEGYIRKKSSYCLGAFPWYGFGNVECCILSYKNQ